MQNLALIHSNMKWVFATLFSNSNRKKRAFPVKQQIVARRRPIRYTALSIAVVGLLFFNRSWAKDLKTSAAAGDASAQSEFVATALTPFWRASEIREPMFFIRGTHGEPPKCQLLFKPKEVLAVRSATRDKTFEARKDYVVDPATGTLSCQPVRESRSRRRSKCIH
jgi:hypothetical protein